MISRFGHRCVACVLWDCLVDVSVSAVECGDARE